MEHSTIIYFLSTKPAVAKLLEEYCKAQNIILKPYPDDTEISMEYLMIIEPIQIGFRYFSLSGLWKAWLMDTAPHTKLIVATHAKRQHPNVLNLLDLPVSLSEWLEEISPVAAFVPQYGGYQVINEQKYDQYADPWDRYSLRTGKQIRSEIENFLKGHDGDHSFRAQLMRVKKAVEDIADMMINRDDFPSDFLEQKTTEYRETIFSNWKKLFDRWEYYQAFFAWLPFRSTTDKMKDYLDELSKHIQDLQKNEKLVPNVVLTQQISDLLEKELQPYVYYEDNY